MKAFLFMSFVCLLLPGCTFGTVSEVQGPKSYHFGYVALEVTGIEDKETLQTKRIETVGMRLQDGFSLGYIEEDWVYVPGDCRLVILVGSEEELKWAEKVLAGYPADSVCKGVRPN